MSEVETKLNGRQKLFADYYVGEASLNATRAAGLAGYAGDDNSLAAAGSRLLRNVKVREYVDDQLKDLTLSKNEVLNILTKQAKGSLADVLDDEGHFNLADAKRRGVDGLLKEIEIKEKVLESAGTRMILERTYKYKIHDSQSAAVHVGKALGVFVDKSEIEHKGAILTNLILPKTDDETSGS